MKDSPVPTVSADDALTREERLHFLRHTHDCVDEQVRFANHKASYILATVGCVFVGCGAALLGPQITNFTAQVLLVVGLVLTSLSGAAACATVFPVLRKRGERPGGSSLMFFGAISQMDPGDYARSVEALDEGRIHAEMCQQIHALSCLAREKYRWIRISTMLLALGLVVSFAAFIGIFMR